MDIADDHRDEENLVRSVEEALERLWETGWQPADVVRAVRKILGPRDGDAVTPAVAASGDLRPEATFDARWAGQIAALRAAGRSATRGSDHVLDGPVLAVLKCLPPLPRLPTGGQRRSAGRHHAVMLERVRALLAKAESTNFPAEAEALTAKAQQLMARHAIDEAMLEASGLPGTSDIVAWRIGVDDPYAAPKSMLLSRVAVANRCRAVWTEGLGFSTVFGVSSDLEIVELLFTSLLVQATEAMVRSGQHVDRYGRSSTRSFRRSFLIAYASRIGERLTQATASAVAEGAERHGDALLPVLASRAEAVEETVRSFCPNIVRHDMAISNYEGWVAGRAAADLASLSVGEHLAAG